MEGTTHVCRAIGYVDKESCVRIYSDDELLILKSWHIVLVGTYRVIVSRVVFPW